MGISETRIISFDLNGTLIHENSWRNLNLAMGITPQEDKDLLERHMRGKITYREGQKILEGWYKKRGLATKKRMIASLIHYSLVSGAKKVVTALRNRGYTPIIISGSIDIIVHKVAETLGIRLYAANNHFVFDRGGKFQEIVIRGDDDATWKTIESLSDLLTFC